MAKLASNSAEKPVTPLPKVSMPFAQNQFTNGSCHRKMP